MRIEASTIFTLITLIGQKREQGREGVGLTALAAITPHFAGLTRRQRASARSASARLALRRPARSRRRALLGPLGSLGALGALGVLGSLGSSGSLGSLGVLGSLGLFYRCMRRSRRRASPDPGRQLTMHHSKCARVLDTVRSAAAAHESRMRGLCNRQRQRPHSPAMRHWSGRDGSAREGKGVGVGV
jgi:hypothetical protein